MKKNTKNDRSTSGRKALDVVSLSAVVVLLLLAAAFGLRATAGVNPCLFDQNRAGNVDCKFGENGFVFTPINPELNNYAEDVVSQPDGKLIAVGSSVNADYDFALVRYSANGQLDPSFGAGGIVTTNVGYDNGATVAAIQSDGRIIVGGFTNTDGNGSQFDFAVVRYLADGTLDGTWGTGGIVVTDLGSISESVFGLVVQSDGKVVVVGYSGADSSGFASDIKLVRYNANGTPDTGFGTAGVVNGPQGVGEDVVLQPDGKIVIAGVAGKDMIVARFLSNGAPDPSFDTDGYVYTDFNENEDRANALALQKDGRIVVAGSTRPGSALDADFALVRYQANGALDVSFDGDGRVTTSNANDTANDVVIQRDGRIVAAGRTIFSGNSDSMIARYNPDGSLDKAFGSGPGVIYVSGSGVYSFAQGVVLQSDGKIVIAGGSNLFVYGPYRFYLVRVKVGGYGPVPRGAFDFEGDGRTDVSVFRPSDSTWYWVNSSNGGFNQIQWGTSGDKAVPADYDGDWKTDLAVFRPSEGKWYILQSSTATLAAYHLGASGDVPLPGHYIGDSDAEPGVYRPSSGDWYWLDPANNNAVASEHFGASGDLPVVADFGNDGATDLAFYRPAEAKWYWKKIGAANFSAFSFGLATDLPVPGDFDGDGKTDHAVFRLENGIGVWYLQRSTAGFATRQFGAPGDRPTAADFDGDGRTDIAVFRPSEARWYWLNSSNDAFNYFNYGLSGDLPLPSSYLP